MSNHNDLKIIIIDDNIAIHQDFIKTLSYVEASELSDVEEQLFGQAELSGRASKWSKDILPRFKIDTALQGKDGVSLIKKALDEGNPYAVAFVDIRMPPGWDGIQTIQHIWAIDPDIQVVICTAYSDYSWEETIESLGQKDNLLILKKPFDTIAVQQLALALTKKWELLQEQRNYTSMLEARVKERTHSLEDLLSVSRGTLESSADGILVLSRENQLVDYNAKLLELLHIPKHLIDMRQGHLIMAHIVAQAEDSSRFASMVMKLGKAVDEVHNEKFNFSDECVLECYSQPYSLNNKIVGRVWSFRDITQRILLEKKLEFQSMHDALTGLPNRALMFDRLYRVIALAKRQQSLFAILFFDIDRFKLVNDSLGHAAGDQLLKLISKRLQLIIRQSDTISRLGGDEFVIVVDGLKKNLDAAKAATHLLAAFDNHFELMGQSLAVSASVGISVYPENGQSIGELLRNADAAMYKAKNMGGAQFQFYTPALGEQIAARLTLENELHEALIKQEFTLHYQPSYDLVTKKISSVEALIRWNHPKKGLLLPVHFIPAAEDTGLIVPIGDWVIKTACEQNKKWQAAGFMPTRVAVNISTKEIRQPDFVKKIRHILKRTGLDPHYLELEIKENDVISLVQSSINPLLELNEMGIHITLNDFGAGASSINYLRRIPLATLKIDQSFIKNINLNTSDEIIIQSIISLAKKLNLDIIADGVETKKQLDFLKNNHCESIQGFYLSKPVTSDEMAVLMEEQSKS